MVCESDSLDTIHLLKAPGMFSPLLEHLEEVIAITIGHRTVSFKHIRRDCVKLILLRIV